MKVNQIKAAPEQRSALDFFPEKINYRSLAAASKGCMGCELYKIGTQTVFGEGKTSSQLMFVGEAPGDEEDLSGHPFVGPAGRLFEKALEEALKHDPQSDFILREIEVLHRGPGRGRVQAPELSAGDAGRAGVQHRPAARR